MDEAEKKYNFRKPGTLLVLALLTAMLFYREAGLQAEASTGPNFLVVKVGGFRAEIQWAQ